AATRALGELADLVRHHREAAPRLAGASRLDRGVEREQVGALRHAVNHLGDLVYVARLGLEAEHLAAGLLHALEDGAHLLERVSRYVYARVRLLARLRREPERLAAPARVDLDNLSALADPPHATLEQRPR